ncbi:MAG: hypothetical protein NTY18_06810 [Deltaproteobacteria bacterium]|nr:hypothetical protein [Deltaproteobacteria bacterium]
MRWRITYVTNPDECNLACPMCATHPEVARASRPAGPPPGAWRFGT